MKHLLLILTFILPLASFSQVLVRDVFDFAVGDTFQTRIYGPNSGGSYYNGLTITQRSDFGNDSIEYIVQSLPTGQSGKIVYANVTDSVFDHFRKKVCISCQPTVVSEEVNGTGEDAEYIGKYTYEDIWTTTQCNIVAITIKREFTAREGLGILKEVNMPQGFCANGAGTIRELVYARKLNGFTYGTPHNSLYTSIGDSPSQLAAVAVAPNPNTGQFSVTLSKHPTSDTKLTIYNLTGQIVSTHLLEYKLTNIDLGMLPKGLYLWQLQADGRAMQNGKLLTQ